jgi:hypothetical protein
MKKLIIAGVALLTLSPLFAQAQETATNPSAKGAKKPSEILSLVEGRTDFARLQEMTWNDEGFFEVVYRTNDKARVEINIDLQGNPVDQP